MNKTEEFPHDGYTTMERSVIAVNTPMRALAAKLGCHVATVQEDATVVRLACALQGKTRPPMAVKPAPNTAAMLPPSDQ